MEDILLEIKDTGVSDYYLRKFGLLDFFYDICRETFLVPEPVTISNPIQVACNYFCSNLTQDTTFQTFLT